MNPKLERKETSNGKLDRKDVHLPSALDFWSYQGSDVLLELPDNSLVITKKSQVLQPFLEDFEEKITSKDKIFQVEKLIKPIISRIKQIDSVFILFSEQRNVLEIKILLKNKRFNRKLSDKLFGIRLAIEEKFDDNQVDFLYIPKFDKKYEELLSEDFEQIYP